MATNQSLIKCAQKSAFIVGYTGEVGKELVRELLERRIFKKVFLIGRRQVAYDDPIYANTEQKIVDFDHLENHKDVFQGIDYGFCCLGTSQAISGDKGFVKVDHDYVVNTAKVAHENGCKQFLIVTAEHANKDSFFLYPKTKGLVEQHVSEIPFEKITIIRPGFILSNKTGRTTKGKILQCGLKPIAWMKPTYMTIPVAKVAKAMIYSTCCDSALVDENKKIEILNNQKLHQVSDNFYDKLFTPNNIQ